MTDRIYSLTVALDHDMRDDDVEALVDAIGCLRHVLSVKENVSDPGLWTVDQRVRRELGEALLQIVYPK
jgi:hypothetical protein